MRTITIFLIWQSDQTAARNNLTKTLKALTEELSLDQLQIVVDQDTRGVAGSPTIDHVIFDKIARADIVVADLTIVGHTPQGGKALPNPNVMLEAGYAFGTIGPERVILVRRTGGLDGDLPFDIRQRRVIEYAKPAELKGKLRLQLETIIDLPPGLPGEPSDRATIVRLLPPPHFHDRIRLGAEFDLISGAPGDLWSKLAIYYRCTKATQWNSTWHYGKNPEVNLEADIRLALVQSTNPEARGAARQRIDRYLAGFHNWQTRDQLRKDLGGFKPPQNTALKFPRDSTSYFDGLHQKVGEVGSTGIDVDAIQSEIGRYESGTGQLGPELSKLLTALQGLLQTQDPCPVDPLAD